MFVRSMMVFIKWFGAYSGIPGWLRGGKLVLAMFLLWFILIFGGHYMGWTPWLIYYTWVAYRPLSWQSKLNVFTWWVVLPLMGWIGVAWLGLYWVLKGVRRLCPFWTAPPEVMVVNAFFLFLFGINMYWLVDHQGVNPERTYHTVFDFLVYNGIHHNDRGQINIYIAAFYFFSGVGIIVMLFGAYGSVFVLLKCWHVGYIGDISQRWYYLAIWAVGFSVKWGHLYYFW